VARTLVRTINARHRENVQAKQNPAERLIVHELAFRCGVVEIDKLLDVYGKLTHACIVKDTARTAEPVAEKESAQRGREC
jgi:hypothetical protein